MTIDLVCVRCGYPMAAHAGTFDIDTGRYRCPDGELCDQGTMLIDSHALDEVPPARRALERARLAQAAHDTRVDVQLPLSSDGAFDDHHG